MGDGWILYSYSLSSHLLPRTCSLYPWLLTSRSAWCPRPFRMQGLRLSSRLCRLWGSMWASGLCPPIHRHSHPSMKAAVPSGACRATPLPWRLAAERQSFNKTEEFKESSWHVSCKYHLAEGNLHPDGPAAGLRRHSEQPAGRDLPAASLPDGAERSSLLECHAPDPDPDHPTRPECASEPALPPHPGQPWRSVSGSPAAHGTLFFRKHWDCSGSWEELLISF